MAKSWLKGLWLVALTGLVSVASLPSDDSAVLDSRSLSQKGYSPMLRQSLDELGFLFELRSLTPDTPSADVLALIHSYEGRLSQSESFYLESCLATIPHDSSLAECERLLYRGLNQLTDHWKIPIVMGMISAMTYKELDKAAAFFNLALSKPHLPDALAGFPRVASDEAERLAVRISSLVRIAAEDPTIEKYRRTLKHTLANRESSSNADPGSQEHREAL